MKEVWLRKVKKARKMLRGCALASYKKRKRKELKAWRRLRIELLALSEELDEEGIESSEIGKIL
jgi:hypothetical protein